jgi:hypothetical protein
MVVGAGPMAAQGPSHHYQSSMFACVQVRQSVTSEVVTVRGEVRREEVVAWSGTAVVQGTSAGNGSISLVMWFDSLDVVRTAPEGQLAPSAAGMIGGRYRGTLDSDGIFTRNAAPFIPEAVRSIVGMDRALDDLWAPAPGAPVLPGGTMTRGPWRFERLTDTILTTGPAWRYRLFRSDSGAVAVEWADGITARGVSVEGEEGRLVWDPVRGPVAWIRRLVTTVTFPESSVTREAVRTEVRQERVFRRGVATPGRCEGQ